MKTIKDNEELKSYIVNGEVKFSESIKCDFSIYIDADIQAHDIQADNIQAGDIQARNIDAHDIEALNIDAHNIDARDIRAINVSAHNIDARNIKADNVDAISVDADNISYYAFFIAYSSLKCYSIVGMRCNSIHKCLDAEIETKKTEINLQGKIFNLSLQELNNLKQQLKLIEL